ncbi:hypothetical protein ACFYZ2_11295 [Streptomyces sviceus]|uniref:hypothetical protein n=1 Tax=Streptomyces sviceus TaxID=285530 RepID=UPI0036CFD378
MGVSHERITDLLGKAAATIKAAPGTEPWQYGWAFSDYRRSDSAALPSSDGPVTMDSDGISAYEEAVEALLSHAVVRDRWDNKEIWAVAASLIVAASETGTTTGFIARNLPRILKPSPALVIFPVANVKWEEAPMALGSKCAIGNAGAEFTDLVSKLGGRASSAQKVISEFTEQQKYEQPPTCFAMLVPGQQDLAFRQASRQFEMLVDISLLLDISKEEHGLHFSREAWNRPGVRGLTLDRGAVERGMRGKKSAVELFSQPLIYDELGKSGSHHWYTASPVPLHAILSHERLRHAVLKSLVDPGSIYRRLRVAGKWFSEAFWASNPDDATLALGVALDALIGAKSALPGRAMRERFALLHDTPSTRASRAKAYEELYRVRSIVAHGGISSKVEEEGFIKSFQQEVTWAAWRLLAVGADFSVSSDADLDEAFEGLRWGTKNWPTDGEGNEINTMLELDTEKDGDTAPLQPCGSEMIRTEESAN